LVHRMQSVGAQNAISWCTECNLLVHRMQSVAAQDTICWCTERNLLVHRMQSVGAQNAVCCCTGYNLLVHRMQSVGAQNAISWCTECNLLVHRMQSVAVQDTLCWSGSFQVIGNGPSVCKRLIRKLSSDFTTAIFEETLFGVFIVQKQLMLPWNQHNRKWRHTEPSQCVRLAAWEPAGLVYNISPRQEVINNCEC